MCLRIFIPTPRRILLFLIFLAFTLSGIMNILYPFQQLFGLPYMLSEGYTALIAQIIYSYIVACIYAASYIWLEAKIRKRYPHMNDLMQKKRSLPAVEKPLAAQEAPATQKAAATSRRKSVKKRKR